MKERIQMSFKCKNCNCNFNSKSARILFCSVECRKEYIVKRDGVLGDDYVICMICNRATANATGSHLKNHLGWTAERYKLEYPNSQTIATKTLVKITAGSVKAGQRMREPEHRKRLSGLYSGENNPMHRSKTSDDKRKSVSPFSPAFYIKQDPALSEAEAKELASKKLKESRIVSWNKDEYWMDKGFSEEEAKEIVSKKQSTFSLEKCIEKYGEEEGTRRWSDRQYKWTKSYKKNNYSKKSQELFSSLYPLISSKYKEIYFATLKNNKVIMDNGRNDEYRLRVNGLVIMPDFFIKDLNKIIEFDGVYWHDYKRRNKPENQRRETEKDVILAENGYQILRITELEWENDPTGTLKRCMDFITS